MKIKQLNVNRKTLSIENSDLLTQDKNVVYLNTVAQVTLVMMVMYLFMTLQKYKG